MDTVLGFICSQDDVHLAVVMTSRYDVMHTVLASSAYKMLYNSLLEFLASQEFSLHATHSFRSSTFGGQLNLFLRLFLEGMYTRNAQMLAIKGL